MNTLKDMSEKHLRDLAVQISAELLKRDKRSLFHMVAREYLANGRIQAIKVVRDALGNGLKEALVIVDYWISSEHWITFTPVGVFNTVPASVRVW